MPKELCSSLHGGFDYTTFPATTTDPQDPQGELYAVLTVERALNILYIILPLFI